MNGSEQNPVRFQRAAAGIQAPVPRPRGPLVDKMSTSGGGASGKVAGRRLFQLGAFPGSKSEGAASTLGLARLDYHKAKPGGTVRLALKAPFILTLTAFGWVCYSPKNGKLASTSFTNKA